MPPVRQLASGLPYAIVSILLVIGSISLALAEQNTSPSAVPSPTPYRSPVIPTSPSGSTETPASPTVPTVTASTVPTMVLAATASPTFKPPTATRPFPTVRVRVATSTAVKIACGPFPGWIKAYVVQPGDTLFRISVRYSTSVARLQQANCKTDSVILVGERLWVPNVATVTPALTVIPYFDTPTDRPTDPSLTTPAETPTATIDP